MRDVARYDWEISQGSLASFPFQLKQGDTPIPTTGLSGRGQIRIVPGGEKVCDLVVAVVDHTTGSWTVTALPAATSAYNFGARSGINDPVVCCYDVELYDPSDATNIRRWIEGEARIWVECTA